MRKFDYSFLKSDNLPSELLNITNFIHEIKKEEGEKKTLNPELFNKLITIAKGSNAIEGIVTTDKRIKALMEQKTEPLNHNEKEIAGYRDALELIHSNYQNISFNEKDILNLHDIMLTLSGSPFKGHWFESSVIFDYSLTHFAVIIFSSLFESSVIFDYSPARLLLFKFQSIKKAKTELKRVPNPGQKQE